MPDQPLTLQQAAMRHGAYRWVEHRLFELTGAWSAGPGLPPALRVHLFSASAAHAAHAAAWFARLPVLAVVDRDAISRPAGPVLAPLVSLLGEGAPTAWAGAGVGARPGAGAAAAGAAAAGAAPGAGAAAAGFVAGLHRVVLPALLASYTRHAARLSPVADEPSLGTAAAIIRAQEAELAAGSGLVDDLLASGGEAAADVAVATLRRILERSAEPDRDLVPWSDTGCAW